jgi:hypothetical protein
MRRGPDSALRILNFAFRHESLKTIPALQANSGQNLPATLTYSGRARRNPRRPIPLRGCPSPQVFSAPPFEKYTSGPFGAPVATTGWLAYLPRQYTENLKLDLLAKIRDHLAA